MKKILSIILICTLLFAMLGYRLSFELRRMELRKEMRAHLIRSSDSASFTFFEFTKSQLAALEWESNTEFRYQQNMYDVVEKTANGDGLTRITCIADTREEALLEEYLNHEKRHGDPTTITIHKLVSIVYLLPSNNFNLGFSTARPTYRLIPGVGVISGAPLAHFQPPRRY